ncbi:MAG: hypothetical protein IH931_00360 [candidate division Zixibacteria bacterium]|nr:hypothetical protein [candidate division Zixibacteria bacterium]
MATTKNQETPLSALSNADSMLDSVSRIVDEHKSVAVESVLLGLMLNGRLSSYETEMIAAAFATGSRPIISKDSETVYFEAVDKSDPNLIISVQQGELAISDPLMKHQGLAVAIFSDWQSIKEIALRIHLKFNKCSAILVSRSSGRVIACSKEFCRTTGMSDSDIMGTEFGSAKGAFLELLGSTKMQLDNIQAGELYLSLISFSDFSLIESESEFKNISFSNNATTTQSSLAESIKVIDEVTATDIHTSRLNALLEKNLHLAISDTILSELDSVTSQIAEISDDFESTGTASHSLSNFKAAIRLILQSILMTHRSEIGTDSKTTMKLVSPLDGNLKIVFTTDANSITRKKITENEWWKLATKLSGKLRFSLKDISDGTDALISELSINFKGHKINDYK